MGGVDSPLTTPICKFSFPNLEFTPKHFVNQYLLLPMLLASNQHLSATTALNNMRGEYIII